ncbi:sigma factor-like helix-turn-helix DNA-binding protein [Streptomyces sp. NPDC020965]|uniref:sigma factor-like helix-turn-helix DNA-binding protein n=1 Tax=Streptomyces sp. NPDC020965 TaxID=3365105 RepID=UPI003793D69C
MSGDDVNADASSQEGPLTRPGLGLPPALDLSPALDLPLDFEAFYLGHQEPFHDYAEVQVGSRHVAEEVIHRAFLEILGGWSGLLRAGNLEQQAWAIVRQAVDEQLTKEDRGPAFVVSGPIAQMLHEAHAQLFREARGQLLTIESPTGLYEAIADLPPRQFEIIVLRYVLKYPADRVAWFVGLSEPAVEYHTRKAKDRLRLHMQRVRRAVEARKAKAAEEAVTVLVALRFAREQLALMQSAVYSTFADLPPRQFEVMTLRYLMGYPVRRVAWLLGLHERTVDHHIRMAKIQYPVLLELPDDQREGKGGR